MTIIHNIFELIGILCVCSFLAFVGIWAVHRNDIALMEEEDMDNEV